MPNPTRQEILDAHQTLRYLCDCLEAEWKIGVTTIKDSKSVIEKALPPKPQPTMAEVEWDDDKHYLAEAANPIWGTVVMLNYDADRAKIQYICYEKPGRTGFASPENLTPTGYQCILTEVQDD